MALWEKVGVPHKGWTCVEMIDLGEGLEDLDNNDRKSYYETCEMCSQEGVRYVHVMSHPEYGRQLRVGYRCAEKMEDDYIVPKQREAILHNTQKRRYNFLQKEWTFKTNGNCVLKYKGCYLTIIPSRFHKGEYGVIFNDASVWEYRGSKINSFEEAKFVAFSLLDNYITEQRAERYSDYYSEWED